MVPRGLQNLGVSTLPWILPLSCRSGPRSPPDPGLRILLGSPPDLDPPERFLDQKLYYGEVAGVLNDSGEEGDHPRGAPRPRTAGAEEAKRPCGID